MEYCIKLTIKDEENKLTFKTKDYKIISDLIENLVKLECKYEIDIKIENLGKHGTVYGYKYQ